MSVVLLGVMNYDVLYSSLKFTKNPYIQADEKQIRELSKSLYLLNVMSFNEIYNKKVPLPEDYRPQNTFPIVDIIQLYKLLKCILYQIEYEPEDQVLKSRQDLADALRTAEALKSKLANLIIERLPEYENASWGFLESC